MLLTPPPIDSDRPLTRPRDVRARWTPLRHALVALAAGALTLACASRGSADGDVVDGSAPDGAEALAPERADAVEASIAGGIDWLVAHQSPDGRWDADGFVVAGGGDIDVGGAGNPNHDVGVTGLALLALLGEGSRAATGDHDEAVQRAAEWLLSQQNEDTGLFGEQVSVAFMYDHAIATFALATLNDASPSAALREGVERGVALIGLARNPYRVWRYAFPPNGENDSSVTGWMILALHAADDSDVRMDEQAFADAIQWFDDMTGESGRVGYRNPGEGSSRIIGRNDQYPLAGEAMSALALLCRSLHGQTPGSEPRMADHAEILLKSLPERSDDGLTNDMYYWFYGSHAMRAMGGERWELWRDAMVPVALAGQSQDGPAAGSWDPVGPWGFYGGRIYSTALMTLTLQSTRAGASIMPGT